MAAQEYKLESIEASRIASDDIDSTFRSSSIGEPLFFFLKPPEAAHD
jgi:hypothetical protein